MSPSKRQLIKERRQQQRRRQRITMIIIIAGGALLIAGLLVAPSIRNQLTPVGNIIEITPEARPMVDGKALGDPNAPVTIEVYEDFQCPSCRNFTQDVEPLIVQNYVATGQVRYIYRQFPFLDNSVPGNESHQAANASMCALEQGRFWDYHDMLFANWKGENQGAFADKRLVAFAEALGLNMDEFNSCFDSNKYQDVIQEDIASGRQVGVTGTPSVVINGKLLVSQLVPSFQDIQKEVDAILAQSNQ
jgi:protein-disulfide isomerase